MREEQKMQVNSFRDLTVWQKSMNLAEDVYKLCQSLPKNEQYGLMSQIQRCAVSIPSNIAEGNQRNNRKEYRQFCGVAYGSSAELETQLILLKRIYDIDVTKQISELDEIQKMLNVLIRKLST